MTVRVGVWELASWREHGPGPPVVCVHGAGVSSRQLRPLVTVLGRRLDAWTLDLPGFGESDKPSYPLTLPAFSDTLVDWLSAVGLDRVCLVGGSFGCQIAVDVAVRHPTRVACLVLVGPTVDPVARAPARLVGRWLRNVVHERPAMARLNMADYREAGLRRMLAAFGEAVTDRVEDKLPHVTAPTLVVRGARDRLAPQEWAEEVTRLLPHARLVVMPGSPHTLPYVDPAGLAHLVDGFLTEVGV